MEGRLVYEVSSDCLPDNAVLNSPTILALQATSRNLGRMYSRTLVFANTAVRPHA